MPNCPCGTGKPFVECCERFISGAIKARTAEELMRSRYSAYTTNRMDYIASTMKGKAAKKFEGKEAGEETQNINWQKLEVINAWSDSSKGIVEFKAYYVLNNVKQVMHEISEFIFENNQWYYVDGITPKIKRNDLCQCGSGKKYKKCCGM